MLTLSVAEARRIMPEMVRDIEQQAGHPLHDDETIGVEITCQQHEPGGFVEIERTSGVDPLHDRALLDRMGAVLAEARARGVLEAAHGPAPRTRRWEPWLVRWIDRHIGAFMVLNLVFAAIIIVWHIVNRHWWFVVGLTGGWTAAFVAGYLPGGSRFPRPCRRGQRLLRRVRGWRPGRLSRMRGWRPW